MFFNGFYDESDDEDSYMSDGCSCGMCGLNPFFRFLMEDLMEGFDFARDPWRNRREKSDAAFSREAAANHKFNEIKDKVEEVLAEKTKVTVRLGCHPKSPSLLKSLPGILIDTIFEFAGLPAARPRPAAAAVPRNAADAPDYIVRSTGGGRVDVNLSDFSIYRSGQKISIPLTSPAEHLTGPCWRDFSKAVRWNDGWDVKRVAATDAEKRELRETRKGKVYFIDVIFTVPGKAAKKRAKAAPSTTSANKKAKTRGPASSTAASDPSLSAGVTAVVPLSPKKKTNPKDARKALDAVIASGVSSATGLVDDKELELAIRAGYSKHFILSQIAMRRGDGDQKPAARKRNGC